MLKSFLTSVSLTLLLLFGIRSDNSATQTKPLTPENRTETVQKLIVASGSAALSIDLDRFTEAGSSSEGSNLATLHFLLAPNSFFTIVVNNNVLRAPLPGSMGLIPQDSANLPAPLSASLRQLVLEKRPSGEAFDLVVRDGGSGFVFFYIEGHHFDYDAGTSSLGISDGRLLVSEEFAKQLGLPLEARAVGTISLTASMQPIEIRTIVNGEVQ
jgi:hypothetical protein